MAENKNEQKFQLPLGMLVSEFLGTGLMGLGLVKKFGGVDFLPALTQYDQSGWLLIGLGFVLTLPFVFYVLSKVREKAEQQKRL